MFHPHIGSVVAFWGPPLASFPTGLEPFVRFSRRDAQKNSLRIKRQLDLMSKLFDSLNHVSSLTLVLTWALGVSNQKV